MLNVFVKQRPTFFNCLFMRFITGISGATVMHKCWFIAFLWCGVVEAEPRIIEPAPSQQRNIGAEVIDCGLECGELRHKEPVHRVRPVGNDRINGAEFCKKDALECSTSSSAASFMFAPDRQAMRDEPRKQNPNNTKQGNVSSAESETENAHMFFWFCIVLAIYSSLTHHGLKHNV